MNSYGIHSIDHLRGLLVRDQIELHGFLQGEIRENSEQLLQSLLDQKEEQVEILGGDNKEPSEAVATPDSGYPQPYQQSNLSDESNHDLLNAIHEHESKLGTFVRDIAKSDELATDLKAMINKVLSSQQILVESLGRMVKTGQVNHL